jgi:hypothetical protein
MIFRTYKDIVRSVGQPIDLDYYMWDIFIEDYQDTICGIYNEQCNGEIFIFTIILAMHHLL